ncbi:MAG TPA: AAA family ATPase, partial [Ktedonobacteraceae bacterium]|nr:AAA family ATPase [Ktedonobacteraceae bacterium]
GLDNLRVVAANSGMVLGKANDRRIEEVLDIVELHGYGKLAYRKYSLGMKQRLGIAAALLTDPELVMLDEPTNGLDPSGMIEIRQLIRRLSSLGQTIFLSSHLLAEVQQVCNRVAILRKGNLVKQGDVRELLRERERVEVRIDQAEQTSSAFDVLRQSQEQGATWISNISIEQNNESKPILIIDAPVARSAEINMLLAHNNLFAAQICPREGNLEEVFLEATTPTSAPSSHMQNGMQRFAPIPEQTEPEKEKEARL